MNSKTQMRKAIAGALTRWREGKGFSTKILSTKLGLKQKTYEAYEQERCVPPIGLLIKLAGFYQTSIEDLIGFETFIEA